MATFKEIPKAQGDNCIAVDRVAENIMEYIDDFQMEETSEVKRMCLRLENIIQIICEQYELNPKTYDENPRQRTGED